MTTTAPNDLYDDLGAEAFHPHEQYEAERRAEEAALEGVRYLARKAIEDYPAEQRTGCITRILHAVAEVLIEERGWSYRQAADAMVMEGVRTGGELERKANYIGRKKWLAARREREGGKS